MPIGQDEIEFEGFLLMVSTLMELSDVCKPPRCVMSYLLVIQEQLKNSTFELVCRQKHGACNVINVSSSSLFRSDFRNSEGTVRRFRD